MTDFNDNDMDSKPEENYCELPASVEEALPDDKLAKEERRKLKIEAKKLKEAEFQKERKERAMKGLKYLMSVSMSYSKFFKDIVTGADLSCSKDSPKCLNKPKNASRKYADITKHIKYFEGGTLRDYQVQGVTWMTVLFENGLNGILADEMGLGKTIQVIALMCHLYERDTTGPFLIIAPLSTIPNWESEFKKFAPKLPVVVFHGTQDERRKLGNLVGKKFSLGSSRVAPVVITTYQMPIMESLLFRHFKWQYIVIDEGHRIKNHKSKLALELRALHSVNRLILTGTPLQNNITELWALLNFLLPHIFKNLDTFAAMFLAEDLENDDELLHQEKKNNLISTIHKVLAPFMLRRLKSDVLTEMTPKKELLVYCPLSKLQRELYQFIIDKNLAGLKGEQEQEEDGPRKKRLCTIKRKYYDYASDDEDFSDLVRHKEKEKEKKANPDYATYITMQNPMMMFKKVVNHPYLIKCPLDTKSEKPSILINEKLVTQSGKMMVLDVLLYKLKKKGHKVLIFTTLVMILDLIEEYMIMRGHEYRRLDGKGTIEKRSQSIREFNENPDILAFIISTRAGGLGLNLIGADTVIFFDRDWNPQVDIQAQDRCHRIGQTKPVVIYTLVTKNTIDERILSRGNIKRRLEKIVIQDGKFKIITNIKDDKEKLETELLELQALLKQGDSSQKIHSNGLIYTDAEIEKLLDRSDLYDLMNKRENKENNSKDSNVKTRVKRRTK